jgi:hypothetical protein
MSSKNNEACSFLKISYYYVKQELNVELDLFANKTIKLGIREYLKKWGEFSLLYP